MHDDQTEWNLGTSDDCEDEHDGREEEEDIAADDMPCDDANNNAEYDYRSRADIAAARTRASAVIVEARSCPTGKIGTACRHEAEGRGIERARPSDIL